jgi:hypothetical protein
LTTLLFMNLLSLIKKIILKKRWTIYEKRKREVLRIQQSGLYTAWANATLVRIQCEACIFFSFCRINIHWILENFFLLMIRGTLSRSQRRRRLSTMLISNMQLFFSGNSSFKTALRWYAHFWMCLSIHWTIFKRDVKC